MAEQSATGRTVLIAGAANIFVGAIKLVAGILVGSSAMLAEAAHSAADTLNQGFLLASLHRGARPADARHPFGYGQERYFWSLLAAFGIFIAGGGFSIFEGLLALGRENSGRPLIAYIVLVVAGLAEGTSFVRAFVQMRGEARRSRTELLDHVPVFGQFLAHRGDGRPGARIIRRQGTTNHRQQQRGIDPWVGGRALPAARRVHTVAEAGLDLVGQRTPLSGPPPPVPARRPLRRGGQRTQPGYAGEPGVRPVRTRAIRAAEWSYSRRCFCPGEPRRNTAGARQARDHARLAPPIPGRANSHIVGGS